MGPPPVGRIRLGCVVGSVAGYSRKLGVLTPGCCLCAKLQRRFPNLLGVSGWCSGRVAIWRIESSNRRFQRSHGQRWRKVEGCDLKLSGALLLYFRASHGLAVTNTVFVHKVADNCTWCRTALGQRSMIDFSVVSSVLQHSDEERGEPVD